MTDEPTVLNADGGEPVGTETPEPTATEKPAYSEAPDQSQEETDVPEVKSERGQNRVQELANKAREAETTVVKTKQENDSLKAELGKLTQPEPKPAMADQSLPWMQQPETRPSLGEEVSQEQYWQHIEAEATKKADTIVDLRLRQRDIRDKIEKNYGNDISDLESSYPEAFESNDPELKAEFKRQFNLYQKTLQVDPEVRFKDFAGPLLKARSIGVEQGKNEAVSTLSQQASESAVQPTTEKSDSMTTEDQLIEAMKSGKITAEEAEKRISQLQ
jgi:hypothetical protein